MTYMNKSIGRNKSNEKNVIESNIKKIIWYEYYWRKS